MSFYKVNKYANSLGYQNKFSVIIPDRCGDGLELDIVYLLHGMWGNHTDFERYNLDVYAEKYGIVLVLVEAHNSYYLNTKNGERFFDYVSREIPNNINTIFNIKIKSNSIIGISMGGYGAMHIGLKMQYRNIANLSGSVKLQNRIDNTDDNRFYNILDSLSDDKKIENLLTEQVKSKIYSYCGTNDFLWTDNCEINDLIKTNGCDYRIEIDNGAHDFESWNNQMGKIFEFFFEEDYGND